MCGLSFSVCSGVLDEARMAFVGPAASADAPAPYCGHGNTLLERHVTEEKKTHTHTHKYKQTRKDQKTLT